MGLKKIAKADASPIVHESLLILGVFYLSLHTASRYPTDLLQAVGKSLGTLHSVYRGSSDAGRHLHKEQGKNIQNKAYFYYAAWRQSDSATEAYGQHIHISKSKRYFISILQNV